MIIIFTNHGLYMYNTCTCDSTYTQVSTILCVCCFLLSLGTARKLQPFIDWYCIYTLARVVLACNTRASITRECNVRASASIHARVNNVMRSQFKCESLALAREVTCELYCTCTLLCTCSP